jgi:UDP-glucose:(heptosyl)LPS alpha-1,3-glucosyltransferase
MTIKGAQTLSNNADSGCKRINDHGTRAQMAEHPFPQVALFIRTFTTYGGVEYNCYRFYRYLKKRNVDVVVFCGENRSNIKDATIIELGLLRPGRFLKTLSFYLKAASVLKNMPKRTVTFAYGKVAGCDIFRTGGGSHLDYMIQSLKGYDSWFFKIKKSLARCITPVNWLAPILERQIFRRDSKTVFIAISTYVAKEITGRFHLEDSKIRIIPNGVDSRIFNFKRRKDVAGSLRRRYGLPDQGVLIGFCSTNFERKGLQYVIDSLKHLPEYYRLLVAGGRRPGKFAVIADKYQVKDRILFLGKVANMPEFYGAIDVLCHPSFHDTFGSVVAEALAMGVPVVISEHVGAKDIVIHGVNGWMLTELSGQSVATAIRNAAAIGVQDFDRYVFSDEAVFEQYYQIIQSRL